MSLPSDPFLLKRKSKAHPARLVLTLRARAIEAYAGIFFDSAALPLTDNVADPINGYPTEDTAVTPDQMGALLSFAAKIPSGSCIVEVGCYRGVTTQILAQSSKSTVYAVDPYSGYGGSQYDHGEFRRRTHDLPNVVHLQTTSGGATKKLAGTRIGFVFIDAVHDFVNTWHDARAWLELVQNEGFVAMHDTDNAEFPGTRLAAKYAARTEKVVCHIPDLVILRKCSRPSLTLLD